MNKKTVISASAALLLMVVVGAGVVSLQSNGQSDQTALINNEPISQESAMEPEISEPVIAEGDRETAILTANWGDNVDITIEEGGVSFISDGVPDHEILDQYLGDGQNGKFISDQPVTSYNASFTFPLEPTFLDSPADTPFGAIGIAVSGAVFFNPFEGDGSGTVANDDNTEIDGIPFIDACGGHPLPQGTQYHYHGVPFCITDAQDTAGQHSEIIGFMLDGVPVYGPQDVDGQEPTDLDQCLGHTGPAPGYGGEIYHYHVSNTANYISECFAAQATAASRPGPR